MLIQYPTSLDPQIWADIEQLLLGTAPPTPQLVLAGWNGAGFALGQLVPTTATSSAPMTRAQGAAVCRAMVQAKGAMSAHASALAGMTWQQWLTLLLQILNGIAGGIPTGAAGS